MHDDRNRNAKLSVSDVEVVMVVVWHYRYDTVGAVEHRLFLALLIFLTLEEDLCSWFGPENSGNEIQHYLLD